MAPMVFRKNTVLIMLLALVSVCIWKYKSMKNRYHQRQVLSGHLGEFFPITGFTDSSGKQALLDLSRSPITIIDFWFSTCPYCLEEMKQFGPLLKGREKQVTLISVSVNNQQVWKYTLVGREPGFAFLKNHSPGWIHLNLASREDTSLHHLLSTDRVEELARKLQVETYPSCFVLDIAGRILARPQSAVAFLKGLP
jgi:thiol-disulfide isomerase/thioredoxin